jgi:hypothetical protein
VTASHHRLALLLATAFAGFWLAAVGLTLTSARLPAAANGWVLAVFPPGVDAAAVSARIVDAEGLPLEPFGVGFAWTAYSRVEGFVGRLEEQGAVLVIPPIGNLRFSGICGAGPELLSSPADTTASAR